MLFKEKFTLLGENFQFFDIFYPKSCFLGVVEREEGLCKFMVLQSGYVQVYLKRRLFKTRFLFIFNLNIVKFIFI